MTGPLLFLLAMASQPVQNAEDVCKAYVVKREAQGESKRGQRAVLDVLQNRMKAKGKKCRAIVAEKHQWSWYRRKIRMKVSKSELQSFRELRTMRPVVPSCTMYFHSGSKPKWAKGRKFVKVVNDHQFYC